MDIQVKGPPQERCPGARGRGGGDVSGMGQGYPLNPYCQSCNGDQCVQGKAAQSTSAWQANLNLATPRTRHQDLEWVLLFLPNEKEGKELKTGTPREPGLLPARGRAGRNRGS